MCFHVGFLLNAKQSFCFVAAVGLVVFNSSVVASQGVQSLPGLVRDTLEQHPSVLSQFRQEQAAQGQIEEAKWQYWPTPSVSVERASAGHSDPSFQGDKQVATVGLRQPLWTGGRLTANLGRAEARAESARQDSELTRLQLSLRVIQAWSDVVAAQASFRAYERSREVHERLLNMVKRRTDEGASSQGDVILAQSRLESVASDIISAASRRDVALERLESLVAHKVDPVTLRVDPAPLPVNRTQSELMKAALDLSPQLARAAAQVSLAEREVDSAKAQMLPEVSLRLERQYGSFSQSGLPPGNRVFVSVSTSFGGGLSNLSSVESARSRQSAALADVETQKLTLLEQVKTDITLAQMSSFRRTSLERSTQFAAEVSESWERQFLAGRKQWLDLMNAARDQAQTDVQLSDVLGAEQLAGWRLKLYTEGVNAVVRP